MLKKIYKKIFAPKRVLFYRDFKAFSGGHQKVSDYYDHLQSSKFFEPFIAFSPDTLWDQSNPWLNFTQSEYQPSNYDYAFLAGMDWERYLSSDNPANQPIVNLVQGVRHADPSADVNQFLSKKAIRICVSQPIADAIKSTGLVNGPIYTIPNGLKLQSFDVVSKKYDILILGIKQPQLASELLERISSAGDYKVCAVLAQMPRGELLGLMSKSKVAILLPLDVEGFYLPALEAMNYCDMVVVPDCIGNRDFCSDGKNCIMPDYNRDAILAGTMRAIELLQNEHVLTDFKCNMRQTVQQHSLANERKAFLDLMKNLDKIWAQ